MELMLALAAVDNSARISEGIRNIFKKSYTSLFANVFPQVIDIEDRKKSDIKLVREMDKDYSPIVVQVEDRNHQRVTFVYAVPTMGQFLHIPNPTKAYLIFNEKVSAFALEPRVVQVRGTDYAIAASVARRAPSYIEFGAK
uniref:Uncharacterized protein n=1 Tax=Pseudomonas phage HRDY3 TaxID=3236930 RepID=A0AB39CE04_9VIRU